MAKVVVKVDDRKVRRMLKALESGKRKSIERTALLESAELLKNTTIRAYKAKTKIKETTAMKKGGSRKLAEVSWNESDFKAKVHIMSHFAVKWFELGTRQRTTKGHKIVGYDYKRRTGKSFYRIRKGKGGNRGKMSPLRIFKTTAYGLERKIYQHMSKKLYRSIMKVAK